MIHQSGWSCSLQTPFNNTIYEPSMMTCEVYIQYWSNNYIILLFSITTLCFKSFHWPEKMLTSTSNHSRFKEFHLMTPSNTAMLLCYDLDQFNSMNLVSWMHKLDDSLIKIVNWIWRLLFVCSYSHVHTPLCLLQNSEQYKSGFTSPAS